MLQLHQRFMKFSTTNFPKIFREIIPEKYRYFSGNFRSTLGGKTFLPENICMKN